MITRLTFDQISTAVHDAYEACKDIKGGQNAHYIPYLANVNSDLFGISLCLPDGRLISVGDTDYRFGIESVSKVHTAILALEQHGAQAILDDIGADATGLPFNSIFAILLENDRPSTPLVNAGAIAACSLVKPHGDADGKWKAIFDNMTALLGSEPQLIDELYQSGRTSTTAPSPGCCRMRPHLRRPGDVARPVHANARWAAAERLASRRPPSPTTA
ncbi:MAG: glutaminase [Coriobacteriaceae bacterium]